jgi:hypothetical protein
MFYPGRVRMLRLPARQLDQRLIFTWILPRETVHPSQPPAIGILLVAANVTRIALCVSHLVAPPLMKIVQRF